MKLFRHGAPGEEHPGIVIENRYYNLRGFNEDFTPQFFESDGLTRLKAFVDKHGSTLPELPKGFRFGMPTINPSKVLCVGFNYGKHAAEKGLPIPKEPELFFKSTTCLCGPDDDVLIPAYSEKSDWEVELAVIIGHRTKQLCPKCAMDYVAGYALFNDLSEREYQFEHGTQWCKGKSYDTYGHYGPFFVTKDEVPEPVALNLWTKVNGIEVQNDNTDDMIFDVPYLMEYCSRFMTLMPGDIISTGTPAGVGMGMKPPQYLKDGDIVEQGIEGLGNTKQKCVKLK